MYNITVEKGFNQTAVTEVLFDAVRGRALPNGWLPDISRHYVPGEKRVVLRDHTGKKVASAIFDTFDL